MDTFPSAEMAECPGGVPIDVSNNCGVATGDNDVTLFAVSSKRYALLYPLDLYKQRRFRAVDIYLCLVIFFPNSREDLIEALGYSVYVHVF